jgi:hypothetical protein
VSKQQLQFAGQEPAAGMLMTLPGMMTTDELAQLFADNNDANDTQNLRRIAKIVSPDRTV